MCGVMIFPVCRRDSVYVGDVFQCVGESVYVCYDI